MTLTQERPITFPEAVLLRPQMYTLGGGLGEAIAFLEGYFSGMAKENPDAPPVRQWAAFEDWLAGRLGVSPSEAFARYKERFENSEEPLRTLAVWFAQFQEERSK